MDKNKNIKHKKSKKKLTIKQRKFIKEFIKSGNATESAKEAGYKGNNQTLRVMGNKLVTNDNIQLDISAALEKQKINDEYLVEKIKDGLNANKKDEADYAIRHRFQETVHKLRGDFAPDKSLVNIESEDIKSLTESMRAIAEGRNAVPDSKPVPEGQNPVKEEVISLPSPSLKLHKIADKEVKIVSQKQPPEIEGLRDIASQSQPAQSRSKLALEESNEEEIEIPETEEETAVREKRSLNDAIKDAETARKARENRK